MLALISILKFTSKKTSTPVAFRFDIVAFTKAYSFEFSVTIPPLRKEVLSMTANQIAYQNLLETRRSNIARETETARHQQAMDTETYRHNVETERLGVLNFGETQRSHRAGEAIELQKLAETNRANLAREAETQRANLAKEAENQRANLKQEALVETANVLRAQDQNLKYAEVRSKEKIASADRAVRREELSQTKTLKEQELQLNAAKLEQQKYEFEESDAPRARADVWRAVWGTASALGSIFAGG